MISLPNPKAAIFQSGASPSVCVAACACVRTCVAVYALYFLTPPLPPTLLYLDPPTPTPEPDWDRVVTKMEKQIRAEEAAGTLLPPGCRTNQHNPPPRPSPPTTTTTSYPHPWRSSWRTDTPPLPTPPREHLFLSVAGGAWPATPRLTPLRVPACKLTGCGRLSHSLPAGIRHGLVMLVDVDGGLMRETYVL